MFWRSPALWAAGEPQVVDHSRSRVHVLVLPEAENGPPLRQQTRVGVAIAGRVPLQLGAPPVGVGNRMRRVNGTPVPEASVDEHRDACSRQEDVGASSGQAWQRTVDPVANPSSKERAPQSHLGHGVASGLPSHAR